MATDHIITLVIAAIRLGVNVTIDIATVKDPVVVLDMTIDYIDRVVIVLRIEDDERAITMADAIAINRAVHDTPTLMHSSVFSTTPRFMRAMLNYEREAGLPDRKHSALRDPKTEITIEELFGDQ